ncbi:CPBP family intramembrane glutamic endopeptidase [Sinorhizobium meliloti]|uniref:CPBP family intramembrane glutamic endopeptidase n=1 Tax=Rhizobium meliloti TaxID=382 RepID=UPI001F1AD7D4
MRQRHQREKAHGNERLPFAGVVLSSIIFGLAHGVSVILPVAIMVGLLSAILFRATGSVWPSVVLHCVYNGANSIASAFGFAPMP